MGSLFEKYKDELEVKRAEDGELWISWNSLEKLGIDFKTLNQGTLRFRDKKSESWKNKSGLFGSDLRRVWISVKTIPDSSVKKILPGATAKAIRGELAERVAEKDPKMEKGKRLAGEMFQDFCLEAGREQLDADAEELRKFKIYNVKADEEGEVLYWGEKTAYLPDEAIHETIGRVRVALFLSQPELKDRAFRLSFWDGFKNYKDFVNYCGAYWKEKGYKVPSNWRRLDDLASKYVEKGAVGCIKGQWGNQKSRKVLDLQIGYLVQLMIRWGDYTKVARLYNQERGKHGWPKMTRQGIEYTLRDSDVMPRWYLERYGEEKFNNKYRYRFKGIPASCRDMRWVIDFTKVNYFYKDRQAGNNTRARLNIGVVLDVYSEYLLGWCILEGREGKIHVGQAMEMAVERSGGYLPHQIQYDNDGANRWFEGVPNIHFAAEAYNGPSKEVELVFGRIQQEIMAEDWNFTGQNVKAKRERSTINLRPILQKWEELPEKDQAIQQMEMVVHKWNNRRGKHGKTPKELYFTSENEKARKVTEKERVECFWKLWGNPITYNNSGLPMYFRAEKPIYYEVMEEQEDGSMLPDMDFYNQHVKTKFFVKYDLKEEVPEKIALYLEDKTDKGKSKCGKFVGYAHKALKTHRAIGDHEEGEMKRIQKLLKDRKGQIAKKKLRNEKDKTRLEFEDIDPSQAYILSKDEQQAAENDYLERLGVVGDSESGSDEEIATPSAHNDGENEEISPVGRNDGESGTPSVGNDGENNKVQIEDFKEDEDRLGRMRMPKIPPLEDEDEVDLYHRKLMEKRAEMKALKRGLEDLE